MFRAWQNIWKDKDGKRTEVEKFHEFQTDYPGNAKGILEVLSIMSYTFSDVNALQHKYGLRFGGDGKVISLDGCNKFDPEADCVPDANRNRLSTLPSA